MIPMRDGGYLTRVSDMRKTLKDNYQWDADHVEVMPLDEVEDAYDKAVMSRSSQEHLLGSVK